jgi:hypothetical protein
MTLDNQRQVWLPWVYQINLRDTGVYAKGAKLQYRVSMNGAATNNLQATTVPTNGGAIPVEGYLVQKKRAELMQDILNMVFRVREQLLPYKVGSI